MHNNLLKQTKYLHKSIYIYKLIYIEFNNESMNDAVNDDDDDDMLPEMKINYHSFQITK